MWSLLDSRYDNRFKPWADDNNTMKAKATDGERYADNRSTMTTDNSIVWDSDNCKTCRVLITVILFLRRVSSRSCELPPKRIEHRWIELSFQALKVKILPPEPPISFDNDILSVYSQVCLCAPAESICRMRVVFQTQGTISLDSVSEMESGPMEALKKSQQVRYKLRIRFWPSRENVPFGDDWS